VLLIVALQSLKCSRNLCICIPFTPQTQQRLDTVTNQLQEADTSKRDLQQQLTRMKDQAHQQAARQSQAAATRPAPLPLPAAAAATAAPAPARAQPQRRTVVAPPPWETISTNNSTNSSDQGRLDARATSTLIWTGDSSAALPFASPASSPAPHRSRLAAADADAPQGLADRDQGSAAAAAAAAAAANGQEDKPGSPAARGFPGFSTPQSRAAASTASGALSMLAALRDSFAARLLSPAAAPAAAPSAGAAPVEGADDPASSSAAAAAATAATSSRPISRGSPLPANRFSGLAELPELLLGAGGDAETAASTASRAASEVNFGGAVNGSFAGAGEIIAASQDSLDGPAGPQQSPARAAGAASATAASPARSARQQAAEQDGSPQRQGRKWERLVKTVVFLTIVVVGASEKVGLDPVCVEKMKRRSKTAMDKSRQVLDASLDRSREVLGASGRACRSAWRRIRRKEDAKPAAAESCCVAKEAEAEVADAPASDAVAAAS